MTGGDFEDDGYPTDNQVSSESELAQAKNQMTEVLTRLGSKEAISGTLSINGTAEVEATVTAQYLSLIHISICSFSYFAIAIILVLVCQTPVAMVEALAGAVFFLHCTEGGKVWKRLRYLLPMLLLIAFANPLLNHRGVTRLVKIMNQWVTLEALCYGITAGLSLAALILWFGCYQEVIKMCIRDSMTME